MIPQSGSSLKPVSKRAIPVAPPSIKLFGSKKLSNPKAAEKIPQRIKIDSLMSCLDAILNFR